MTSTPDPIPPLPGPHGLLWAEDSRDVLLQELGTPSFPAEAVNSSGHESWPALINASFEIVPGRPLPHLAFARQLLPWARPVRCESIRSWVETIYRATAGVLPEDQPWSLHVEPHYGAAEPGRVGARAWHTAKIRAGKHAIRREPRSLDQAGRHRCALIKTELLDLLQRKRRHLRRRLRLISGPFSPNDSLVQVLLTSPSTGYISVAPSPVPYDQRHLVSPFPKGTVSLAPDHEAPSRAFAKLMEAERRLGRGIGSGERCVDLGAAPGSWTYVAVRRGARVVAVDRAPLRADLMPPECRLVEFIRGDAFEYQPTANVDWLLCDVIAAPERTVDLIRKWLRAAWCRSFVVTIKLKAGFEMATVERLKAELPGLTSELRIVRLNANKMELCVFGEASRELSGPRGRTGPEDLLPRWCWRSRNRCRRS